MSRIGKKIRIIPQGVTAEMHQNKMVVKGPKGELTQTIHPRVTVVIADGQITFSVPNQESKADKALWGTFSSLVENMIQGVTVGFKKDLEINGVGYKASLKGTTLVLEIGYSHPVEVLPPAGIKFSVEKNIISVEGIEKQQVGEIAAQIRALKKAEPYKGKGIKYVGEIIRRKAGKTAAKAAS
ncbi:MAG: 50S ribosomal protein L6 [Candidatus Magasanikbacteria bacterium GW2011_GWC2_34_16]|uniref:Large ribosomal subunit protein uL6 n=2 Tax=Candidatus Magasanikiibacteriota TaxID=1752731 RepID=A0A0G0KFH2_9BACT|nr:MAG: 50S ribosomal protein L6 [Candidatus Magasanikbacteria bacterium GW2011_GWC2_34_16]KKQ39296.1 MAG: 50S ribosomal protein L6 [Candidatus Magasanikbacteria bacterium GW2011_GWA2_37_8]